MKTAQTRQEAFALFLRGASLRGVAATLGIGRSTVERWSQREQWVEQRRDAWLKAKNEVRQQYAEKFCDEAISLAESLYRIFATAHSQHQAYTEGALPRKAMRYTARELCALAKAIVEAGNGEVALAYALAQRL